MNVNSQMSVVREEIFGPVVVAQPFDDLADMARFANHNVLDATMPFGDYSYLESKSVCINITA